MLTSSELIQRRELRKEVDRLKFHVTLLAIIAISALVTALYASYNLSDRIDPLEKIACGFVQYEDLSVMPQANDSERWDCYYGKP